MKKNFIKISLFISFVIFVFADQIDTNKKRINEIDNQVKKNNQTINNNKAAINKAKNTEANTQKQIKQLDSDIKKLEKEYNEAEKQYREILTKIGINDFNISKQIEEINKNSEIIKYNKEDLHNKIKIWDKIRRNNEQNSKMGVIFASKQVKMNHDMKILLHKQQGYIQGIEELRNSVETEKEKEESIKELNETEAKKLSDAQKNLESKSKQLNAAKKEKNTLISELRSQQSKLSTENKNIETKNKQLAEEKRKLNAQIQAIIQRSIRERELAMQKAEEQRIEEERIRREAEAKNQTSEERKSNNQIAGVKQTPPSTTSSTTFVTGTGVLSKPINGQIVLKYGEEKTSGLKSNGIEIRGSSGQSVSAADSGTVIYSGSLNGLGSVVIIDHGSLITVYGNLATVSVSKGSNVKKGQNIGTLGRDQISKEPNLYFEVRKGVNTVNPSSYF